MRIIFNFIFIFLFFDFAGASLKDTVQGKYNASEFIFIGKIKGMQASEKAGLRIYEIDVIEIYKGKRWASVMLVADTGKFSFDLFQCGYHYRKKREEEKSFLFNSASQFAC